MIDPGELHMDCIGTWKEGSDIYLYVRISREGLHKPDETYRCLVRISQKHFRINWCKMLFFNAKLKKKFIM